MIVPEITPNILNVKSTSTRKGSNIMAKCKISHPSMRNGFCYVYAMCDTGNMANHALMDEDVFRRLSPTASLTQTTIELTGAGGSKLQPIGRPPDMLHLLRARRDVDYTPNSPCEPTRWWSVPLSSGTARQRRPGSGPRRHAMGLRSLGSEGHGLRE